MSKKHENPYRKSSAYYNVFNDLRAAGASGITKQALLDKGHKTADVTVVLSPRLTSKRGDKTGRGNYSSQGHIYYIKTLVRKIVDGVKESKRFSLGWRKVQLEPSKRPVKVVIASEKTATEAVAKSEAKSEAKSKAKSKAKAVEA